MMGPPGAGKDTQAKQFAEACGVLWIPTGDMLREATKARTAVGQRAQIWMDRGELVDGETAIRLVVDRMGQDGARHGSVLDGFPRTVGGG